MRSVEHLGKRVEFRLPPGDHAPGIAREAVARACHDWHLPQLSDDAQLIVSELVTNGVLHAGTDLRVTVALGRNHLHLYVHDLGGHLPRLAPEPRHAATSVGGMGLMLVDRLATTWGTTIGAAGKTVWATLDVVV